MTAIDQLQSELAFNLGESGNIFSEAAQMYYIPRGTAKANHSTARLGPFDIALEPSSTLRENDQSCSSHNFSRIADVQRADVSNIELDSFLQDATTSELFMIVEILERDIATTSVRIIKTAPVTAGRDYK